RQIVNELDKYIIGQDAAKRAVAIALRNRYRRMQLDGDIRDEIIPKNILMMGTTGVGKTEIARRLANLAQAPFVKVEATKFTEVGYVGRDVDAIVRDLTEVAVRMVQSEKMDEVEDEAAQRAEERILHILAGDPPPASAGPPPPPMVFPVPGAPAAPPEETPEQRVEREKRERRAANVREFTRGRLEAGELEDKQIEIEVDEGSSRNLQIFSGAGFEEVFFNMQDVMGNLMGRSKAKKRTTVREARTILAYEEAQKLIDNDEVTREAIKRVEQRGIVFLDELDKVAGREGGHGPDVSREGVQRDILPIIEGSTVLTKYGPVDTQHVLFIAAGAFHVSKPSDLIPELQGRFPLRVELDDLTEDDFKRILVEPRNALVRQYTALLATENIQLKFTEDGIAAIAGAAAQVNEQAENIGARRLHTVMERLLEDVSFKAPEEGAGPLEVDATFVQEGIEELVEDEDLSRYIL
ncbi:MAG: ATP-dependent protease ATPase subunit HslU, partial [Armatimonadota bacterium]